MAEFDKGYHTGKLAYWYMLEFLILGLLHQICKQQIRRNQKNINYNEKLILCFLRWFHHV